MRSVLYKLLLAATALAVSGSTLSAQSVLQSGTVTPNQGVRWVSNGVVGNAGTAADGLLSTLGITSNGNASFCISSARASAAGRNQLCFGASTAAAAVISLQNYGTAAAQNLQFVINGTTLTLPTGGGSTIPTVTLPLVSLQTICASGTAGILAGCTGTTNTIPYWSSSTLQTNMAAAASSVLITSAGSVPSLSQTLPSAVQANITATGTVASGVWNGTAVTVPFGGTGATSLASGALVGNGTSAITSVSTASVGLCLLSNGTGVAPSWGGCASGAGSAAGSNTQVQFNNSSALGASANLTWVSPALTIGVNATATGQLVLANGGALGVSVTLQNPSATGTYNFNLPTTAGTSGQPLLSGGGGSTAMSFGTLGIAGGGTNCVAASGTCLDNVSGFSSTGFINRTGAGAYTFTPQIGLANGGTAANLTASNGGIVYSTASALAILSGTAVANQILLSGASAAPAWSTTTYPATTTANQLLYTISTNTVTGLTSGNNGVLTTSGTGVPSISSTIPSATQDNITRLGTIVSGVWTGTSIALANGGTAASLAASTGGIVYSGASAMAILSGTATASLPLLSGSSAAPTWATITYPTSATSGGVPYFSSTSAIASSAALGANQIVIGGGAGAAPSTFACATTTTVVHGGTPPTCSQIVAGDVTTNTLTNATLAQAAANTFKGNATTSTANVADFTITSLTTKASPAAGDLIIIEDSAAAGALKKATVSSVASAGSVASIAGNTGAFTLANGIDNSTNQIQLTAARRTLPTVQILTSGTNATYTAPANVLWIRIRMCGGGAGGSGSGTGGGGTVGSTGGSTCWKTSGTACSTPDLQATGGVPGTSGVSGAAAVGGAATGGNVLNIAGNGGMALISAGTLGGNAAGGAGPGGPWGGGGPSGYGATVGGAASGYCAGGGGAGGTATNIAGQGGAAGGYVEHIINTPAATYVYTIGAAGSAGNAGTSGNNGGVGTQGVIIVEEHYGS